jgi:hypothetical protein
LRIFGLESEVDTITDTDVILAKFSDAAKISGWAKNAVAYAVKNGLVQGYTDGTFGPKEALNAEAYCTLILRQLGYVSDYNNAPWELADKGGLSSEEAATFAGKKLAKDDLVGISFSALSAIDHNHSKKLIEYLVEKKVVDATVALDFGLIEAKDPMPVSGGGKSNRDRDKPPILSETGISDITDTSATLNFTSNEAGFYCYLVYSAGNEGSPNAATIKVHGTRGIAEAIMNTASITDLTAGTSYKAYVIVEDLAENLSKVSTILFSTTATSAERAVSEYETGPITTLIEVADAERLKDAAVTAVAAIGDTDVKSAFEARITDRAAIISDARKRLEEELIAQLHEIPEQMNTLALNADTEAESAGEAGRDFAFVANESRALAEEIPPLLDTAQATGIETVKDQLEEICYRINRLALDAAIEAAKAGEAGRGFAIIASDIRSQAQEMQELLSRVP